MPRVVLPVLLPVLLLAPAVHAQTAPSTQPQKVGAEFTTERLEQLVAPIALYPDALLAQVLMASTYPLEIVEAARWLQKQPKLPPDQLEAALKDVEWDPSVKSLCAFPGVLARLNDNLQWTQDLGDAFLAQKAKLMDIVQWMRRKALEAGHLKSSPEQKVTEQEDKIIVIESTEPDVIYVPTYYPSAVYGGWGYPTYHYPPIYAPPPPGSLFFSFTAGMFWGAAIWGGCHWGWGHTDIDIDVDRYNNFARNTDHIAHHNQIQGKAGSRDAWRHDPQHRKGVNYRDSRVAQQYGGTPGSSRVTRDQARGYADRSPQRPTAGARDVGAQRPAAGGAARPQPAQRPSAGTGVRPAPAPQPSGTRTSGQASGSFSGARNPGLDRASSARGSASRGSSGARGGGARGGGGRGR
ncbi:MAG: DUF3300 domain-containing protein [Planctomycetes bacterium]|nr:DUF3300 domain-containing protein [Planctomycetota bacterium]